MDDQVATAGDPPEPAVPVIVDIGNGGDGHVDPAVGTTPLPISDNNTKLVPMGLGNPELCGNDDHNAGETRADIGGPHQSAELAEGSLEDSVSVKTGNGSGYVPRTMEKAPEVVKEEGKGATAEDEMRTADFDPTLTGEMENYSDSDRVKKTSSDKDDGAAIVGEGTSPAASKPDVVEESFVLTTHAKSSVLRPSTLPDYRKSENTKAVVRETCFSSATNIPSATQRSSSDNGKKKILERSNSAPADMDHSNLTKSAGQQSTGDLASDSGSASAVHQQINKGQRKAGSSLLWNGLPPPVPQISGSRRQQKGLVTKTSDNVAPQQIPAHVRKISHQSVLSVGSSPVAGNTMPTYSQFHGNDATSYGLFPQSQQEIVSIVLGGGSPVAPLLPLTQSPAPAVLPHQPPPPGEATAAAAGDRRSQGTSSDMDTILTTPRGSDSSDTEQIVGRSPHGRYVRFNEKLGSGAYKDVFRAYDTIEGIEVAWNEVNLLGVPKTERSRIVNEVRLLERLHHNNIISFYGSWVNRELEQVVFVTEILSSGTLKSFINKVQVIRWKIAKRWAIQILKGLEYLHSQDPPIIHRDLKCDNIFINGTTGDLRIGDFGLSTMINNKDRVLSVLGTPEFMAPELYNEVYNEKVDIYAFGMCLLEMSTKEVPYSECTNPAQIYKKVSNDVPPESLRRIHNADARNFIAHCLGSDDGKGGYNRPSAIQLMRHPFLAKRGDDDSEVSVDPPLPTIPEIAQQGVAQGESLGESSFATASTWKRSDPYISPHSSAVQRTDQPDTVGKLRVGELRSKNSDVMKMPGKFVAERKDSSSETGSQQIRHLSDSQGPAVVSVPEKTKRPQQFGGENYRDMDDDHFSGMADSEVNMKKVKVLMGRGQEIEDDEESENVPQLESAAGQAADDVRPRMKEGNGDGAGAVLHRAQADVLGVTALSQHEVAADSSTLSTTIVPASKYLSFAGVVEEETYEDDILGLIVTLPVEGQTQNVQFDFHLVADDPVQVAREMVTELDIPEDAVLEISETISGMARAARIRQGRLRMQQQQGQQGQQQAMFNANFGQVSEQSQMQQQGNQQQQQGMIMQQQLPQMGAGSFPEGVLPPQHQQQQQQHVMPPFDGNLQSIPSQSSMSANGGIQMIVPTLGNVMIQQSHIQSIADSAPLPQAATAALQQQQLSQKAQPKIPLHTVSSALGGTGAEGGLMKPQQTAASHSMNNLSEMSECFDGADSVTMKQTPMPLPRQQLPAVPHVESESLVSQNNATESAIGNRQEAGPQLTASQQWTAGSITQNLARQQLPAVPYAESESLVSQLTEPLAQQTAQQWAAGSVTPKLLSANIIADDIGKSTPLHQWQIDTVVQPPSQFVSFNATNNAPAIESHNSPTSFLKPNETSVGKSIGDDENNAYSHDNTVDAEDMRRLEEDHLKSVARVMRAFDTRMDNMLRSKQDKEAQHLKTLEKHKRERIEFEKRLRLAEEEQNRRLEHLQKELKKKKENLVKPRMCVPSADENVVREHKDDQRKARRKMNDVQLGDTAGKCHVRDSSPIGQSNQETG